jgi:hypothetical protein
VNHRIVSQTLVIAVGISEDGGREVLGVMVGDSETEAFWSEFLRASRERGLGHRRAQRDARRVDRLPPPLPVEGSMSAIHAAEHTSHALPNTPNATHD